MNNLREKCGIFGVFGKGLDVSRLTFFGLFALQHRGQESSGIATADGTRLMCFKNSGLVTHAYEEDNIKLLTGHLAIGHNRYSTSQGTGLAHAQPVVVRPTLAPPRNVCERGTTTADGLLALAHNGNLPSVTSLLEFLGEKGIPTEGKSDSELMAEAIGYYFDQGKTLPEAVAAAFPLFTGAFSLLVMTKDTLVAVRDSCGIRPLSIGRLNSGFVFTSETCALKPIGAEFVREVLPGEMVAVSERGMEATQIVPPNPKLDIFEFVYFARPDSELLGKSVYEVRRNFGVHLAKEFPVDADIVVPVPETAIPVAMGYSQTSGIPMEMALVKNRYIHRTFIEPDPHSRDLGVMLKLTPLPGMLRGKRVVVLDDSIVRGTTSRQIIHGLFEAGAKEVHFLISSPPIQFPDFYGIDTPLQKDLIASQKTVEEIREFLGATSLYYLSLDGLIASTGLSRDQFCMACFTGEYPIDLRERAGDFKKPAFSERLLSSKAA